MPIGWPPPRAAAAAQSEGRELFYRDTSRRAGRAGPGVEGARGGRPLSAPPHRPVPSAGIRLGAERPGLGGCCPSTSAGPRNGVGPSYGAYLPLILGSVFAAVVLVGTLAGPYVVAAAALLAPGTAAGMAAPPERNNRADGAAPEPFRTELRAPSGKEGIGPKIILEAGS